MDSVIQERINVWLNGNYDAETKNIIAEFQKSNPDELLGKGVNSSILFGSKNFFEMLEKHLKLKKNEMIIGVSISDTTINVIFGKKE